MSISLRTTTPRPVKNLQSTPVTLFRLDHTAMSRKSNPSSKEALNGSSASSYAYGNTQALSSFTNIKSSQSAYYTEASSSSACNPSYPERYDGSAVAYQYLPRTQLSQDNGYYAYQTYVSKESYYILPDVGEPQAASYPSELTIEEEKQDTSLNEQQNQSACNPSPHHNQAADQTYCAQSNFQNTSQASPTTDRWSAQQFPEERLRLGLPRWENEEQQRAAYKDVHRS